MGRHDELHLLAQRADELSRLPSHARAARREEAAAVSNAILAVATPDGVARARTLLEARFGPQIRAVGEAALSDPWWLFRRDDGQPPVVLALVAGALTPRSSSLGEPGKGDGMSLNKDIAVLAKKIYELSSLPIAELESRKWEALLILNAVYSSSTPDGVAKANADKEARWGAEIRDAGLLSALHPKWHLRTDDGKPPAARFALVSALDNPHRDLRNRLAALLLIPVADRAPLTDLVRALVADAIAGATSEAREKFSRTMNRISKRWMAESWLTMEPYEGSAPILILIDGQGVINDGGFLDKDPIDDPLVATMWNNAIRTWDVDFLRDNPLAQLFTAVETGAVAAAQTAGELADGANQAAKRIARLLAWMPYIVGGLGVVGATAIIIASVHRSQPELTPAPA